MGCVAGVKSRLIEFENDMKLGVARNRGKNDSASCLVGDLLKKFRQVDILKF
jgi:hypothetical protein